MAGDGRTVVAVSFFPFDGSGSHDISNTLAITSSDQELPNLLPFGTHNFAFRSKPVLTKISYDGYYGVAIG